jgi:dipeptidyl aminopeptidase/acylaminoacyl peptidase/CubicO group peptidase (beta-lactamase class C family)
MTRRQRIEDLTGFALPGQPALSPDGREVVYVLTTVDAAADKNVTSLWRADAGGGAAGGGSADGTRSGSADSTRSGSADSTRSGNARQLTRGTADTAPAWSPDGAKIAFLRAGSALGGSAPGSNPGSTLSGGPTQVWLLPAAGGEPEQVTALPLGAGAPAWSPDGSKIAFGAPVDLHAMPGEDDAARARRATAPVVATRLDYKADGAGLLRTIRKHLHVLDLASGKVRQVTEGDWHASDPVWSPDSARLAFGAAGGLDGAPDADLRFRAPLYTVDVSGGWARPVEVALADGYGAPAAWTPDGSALIVIGRDRVGEPAVATRGDDPMRAARAAVGHAALLRVPLSPAGDITDLAGSLDRNVMGGGPGYPGGVPALTDGGSTALFCVRDRGCTHLYAVPADGSGAPRPVLAEAGHVVSGLSVAGGKAAVVLATPSSFGEIVIVDLASRGRTTLTGHGAGQSSAGQERGAGQDAAGLYLREPREFTISDGTTVEGWLIRDPGTAGPAPLLLDIHGGPHNAWHGAADPVHVYHQVLAARGWAVLLLNPRASDGYGEAFYTAAVGAWGVADARDFLEPVEELVAAGVADPARLAVTGYSYGGYMTCYLTSRDSRFAAAVAGGAVSDLTSMAGTSDAARELSDWEWGADSPRGRDFSASDPITRVTDVTTPTLLLHGDADIRCPVGQAEEWHVALRELRVDSQLVRYPGASHLFILDGMPSHRIDYNQRVVDWVEQYASTSSRPKGDPVLMSSAHWQRRLAVLAERHKVPGASLGILRLGRDGKPDELVEASYGYANVPAKIEATADTLFQIGSISKVWTATVVMQLVDEGKLDLDAPVAEVLPELQLADSGVAKTVTMRQLLSHISGIEGDVFTDTGRGDDCVEKYVALMGEVKQNHPLGATWSYCNSGFVLAGRVIEKLTGLTWDAALREKLFTPLGLKHTVTLPEEALLFRTASGHVDVSNEPVLAPVWQLPRSLGPAGLITSIPADVLAFARMHLTGGLAADGTRVLSARSAAAMTEFQAEVPDKYVLGDSWGIGWIRFGWDGQRLIGHDGNTIGQAAFLRILPDPDNAGAGLAVTLLTNGGHTRDLYGDLYREIFAELAGVSMPTPITPPTHSTGAQSPGAAQPVQADITPHLGRYERAGVTMEILPGTVLEDGVETAGPVLRTTLTGPLAELEPDDTVHTYPMTAISQDLYVVREPGTETWIPVTFYALATGERYLHFGARATPKVDG